MLLVRASLKIPQLKFLEIKVSRVLSSFKALIM